MLARTRTDSRGCEGRPTIRGLRITVEFDVYQAERHGAWLASCCSLPGPRRGEADTRHTAR
jgi:hypothetical protein